jgi:hypothetical protein
MPARGYRIEVRSGPRVVTSGVTDASGHVTFTVAPGTYTVACSVPSEPVAVTAGGTSPVDCVFSVP